MAVRVVVAQAEVDLVDDGDAATRTHYLGDMAAISARAIEAPVGMAGSASSTPRVAGVQRAATDAASSWSGWRRGPAAAPARHARAKRPGGCRELVGISTSSPASTNARQASTARPMRPR